MLAQNLTPPFALKGLGFDHKTDVGTEKLHLASLDNQCTIAGASDYLVEEMVTDVLAKLLVNLKRNPVRKGN